MESRSGLFFNNTPRQDNFQKNKRYSWVTKEEAPAKSTGEVEQGLGSYSGSLEGGKEEVRQPREFKEKL